ncbi:MAG TPA: type Z 30S ribosomal protein S14 [bacterium]|nr:type Z 30S ribosomal protein S14 [bacterium]HPO07662.1 type Z 30S ribosomal protein S14 [bacterium]HQO33979.1 type Z 30S ribosomal protein S14 [bacterium]HQQ00319.1 type Z 30S ribosomal protein S14 [bacterium]
MAKTSQRVRARRPQKFKVREYHRCKRCGRSRGYYRKFQLCRVCVRQLALGGSLPGVIKASW